MKFVGASVEVAELRLLLSKISSAVIDLLIAIMDRLFCRSSRESILTTAIPVR